MSIRQLSAKLLSILDFKVEVALVFALEEDLYFDVPFVLYKDLFVSFWGVTDLLLLLLWLISVITHFGT